MIAGRLRECLRTLRWDATDLVATLSRGASEVEGWFDGRTKVPLGVAAWLEALVKAHQSLPPPALSIHAKTPVEAADASLALESRQASWHVPAAQRFYPRRAVAASHASARRGLLSPSPRKEQAMDHTRFEKPVDILVGLGFPRRIESAMEACILLQDWPGGNHNRTCAVALNACKAAIAGDIDPETARGTFCAFAEKGGILISSKVPAPWLEDLTPQVAA